MRSGCRKGTTGLETSLGRYQLMEVEGAWDAEAGLSHAVPGTPSAPSSLSSTRVLCGGARLYSV